MSRGNKSRLCSKTCGGDNIFLVLKITFCKRIFLSVKNHSNQKKNIKRAMQVPPPQGKLWVGQRLEQISISIYNRYIYEEAQDPTLKSKIRLAGDH